jgi:hypothetical protein
MSFPRFLADEDLRYSIVSAVRRTAATMDITTVREQGIGSVSDKEVLDFAWQERWLVLSHDVNTMKSTAERRIRDGRGIHGLFLVPQSRPTRPVAECVFLIWSASEFEEWQNRIVYLPF